VGGIVFVNVGAIVDGEKEGVIVEGAEVFLKVGNLVGK